MTIEQIREMVKGSEYEFLRTNPHLNGKIIFLTLGGSYSYGTNVDTSDVDIRGCALNSPTDLLGLTNFEQVVNTQTDTTIYSFNKLVSLLLNCNPNTIEMLGCRPEHYFYLDEAGKAMIDNRKLFLSQRAVKSFKDRYTSFDKGSILLYTDDSEREDLDREIFADIHLDKYPAREFNSMMNDLHNVLSSYEKLNHRNHKKDYQHLNKHAMHLIRLYLMCLDILEKGDIITYREADHDLLMGIRYGKYQQEDGTYRQEFFDMVNEFEKRMAYAKENTSLPKHPDMKRIEEFVMDVNRRSLYV